jgi:nucleoside-diphosphate-sugar epimerase
MINDSSTKRKVALVVCANGVIGRNLIDHLIILPDWDVIGVSRRSGESTGRVQYVAADLLDINDIREKLNGLNEVTHIFYAAYQGPSNLGRTCTTQPRHAGEHRRSDRTNRAELETC